MHPNGCQHKKKLNKGKNGLVNQFHLRSNIVEPKMSSNTKKTKTNADILIFLSVSSKNCLRIICGPRVFALFAISIVEKYYENKALV